MNSLLHSLCPHAPGDSALYPSVPHSTCSWQVSFYYSLLFEKHENLTVNLEFKKINVLKLFPPWRRLFTTCSGCLMEGFSTSVHINKGIHSEIPPTALMTKMYLHYEASTSVHSARGRSDVSDLLTVVTVTVSGINYLVYARFLMSEAWLQFRWGGRWRGGENINGHT